MAGCSLMPFQPSSPELAFDTQAGLHTERYRMMCHGSPPQKNRSPTSMCHDSGIREVRCRTSTFTQTAHPATDGFVAERPGCEKSQYHFVDRTFAARQQSVPMRHLCVFVLLLFWAACGYAQSNSYLFVWAGDDAKKSSDFLAVLDADSKSPHYGEVVASVSVPGPSGTPHHTELEMPDGGFLLANAFESGRTMLF